jgi:hypothetical protein
MRNSAFGEITTLISLVTTLPDEIYVYNYIYITTLVGAKPHLAA